MSREEPDVLAGSVLSCKGNSLTFPSSAELFNNATKFVDSQVSRNLQKGSFCLLRLTSDFFLVFTFDIAMNLISRLIILSPSGSFQGTNK